MFRLIILTVLSAFLSACGNDTNIYDFHSKSSVTYKNVSSVVSGRVTPPPGEILGKIEILPFQNVTNDSGEIISDAIPYRIATPSLCLSRLNSPSDYGLLSSPSELICPDNNYYFAKVNSPSAMVMRATFNQKTFFDRLTNTLAEELMALWSPAWITITVYNEWEGANGITLMVANPTGLNNMNFNQIAHFDLSYKAARIALFNPATGWSDKLRNPNIINSFYSYYAALASLSPGKAPANNSVYPSLLNELYASMRTEIINDRELAQNYVCRDWSDCHEQMLAIKRELCPFVVPAIDCSL